jgi:hypothetical protein
MLRVRKGVVSLAMHRGMTMLWVVALLAAERGDGEALSRTYSIDGAKRSC